VSAPPVSTYRYRGRADGAALTIELLDLLAQAPSSAPRLAAQLDLDERRVRRLLQRFAEDEYAELIDPRSGVMLYAIGPRVRELAARLLIGRAVVLARSSSHEHHERKGAPPCPPQPCPAT
jgi:DNA-binding IclR family transcriptional regulator